MTNPRRPPFDAELAGPLAAIPMDDVFRTAEQVIARERANSSATREAVESEGVTTRDVTIDGHDGGQITLSIIERPGRTGTGPGIFYIHGGGMVSGNRWLGAQEFIPQIRESNAVVVTVEYRLAPENPHPIPVEDCHAGLLWTAAHAAELGVDPGRLLLAGGSAGGGLAAGVALMNRDRHGPELCGQLLMCPMLDDRDSTVSTLQYADAGLWTRSTNVVGWTALLGEAKGGDDVHEYAAPARATDLADLPPAYIDCGSAEVFRDEDVAYAQAIWAVGGQAELHVWAGGFHAFDGFVPDAAVSRVAVATRQAWINKTLAV
jgi:acetyl esterase/lipase